MEIVYHLGVHCTDDDRIARCLIRSSGTLIREGVVVPRPRIYRYLFRDLISRLGGAHADQEVQNLVLDSIMTQDEPKRVIFANYDFLGLRTEAFGKGVFYPGGISRLVALRNIFPDNPVSLSLAIRNPATFVAALYSGSGQTDFGAFMTGTDPTKLQWSEFISRIKTALPDCPVTLWCNEDSPVLWPVIIRAVAGVEDTVPLTGDENFLTELMSQEGMTRMRGYFADHPPSSEARRRRAVAAFLEKFGKPEQIEMELDIPGWTDELVTAMTAAYDADIAKIAEMPGVTVLR